MYILISVFIFYAMGIISYEFSFFSYYFIALLGSCVYWSIKTKHFIYSSVIVAFVILAYINCNYNSIFTLKQYVNEEPYFTAYVKNQNKINPDSEYYSFNASVTSINNNALHEKENTIIYVKKCVHVKENSIIEFKGSVSDANFTKNKMLFNYNNYLRSKKIGAVIFAKDITIIKEDYSYLNNVALKFRSYAEQSFYNSLNKENADIILSVILGDVDYLNENLYDNIKSMGLAHIFAVSGSHIVLMYGFLLAVLRALYLGRRTSWVVTWLIIWFYGFLIGFPLSVMRTLVMFTFLFGAEAFYRKYSSLNSIGIAALILTMYNPYWIFDAGFLLSFTAALSLIIYNKYILKHITTKNIILRSVYLYLFLQLFTLPVIAYYFNYVPVMGILYNLLLLSIFTVILIYGFLLLIFNFAFSFLLTIPFIFFDYLLYALRFFINITEQFAFNGLTVPTMSYVLIIYFYIVIGAAIYAYYNKNHVINTYLTAVLLTFYSINFVWLPFVDDTLYFNVADAGQGLFTTIHYKNSDFIIDCGSNSSKSFGKYTAVPYLVKRGVNDVDGLFISHWDSDHTSGLKDILHSHIKVNKIFSSFNDNNNEFNNIEILNKGKRLMLDDNLSIEILWPDENLQPNNINNSSLVILIKFNDRRILLTGDIEKETEKVLQVDMKKVDIVIVPHHGSKTSSSQEFVESLNPEIAVISYGKNNYGMPSNEVLFRYNEENSTVLTTFSEGEINFILKGNKMYYNTYTSQKSENYNELYFIDIVPNLLNFLMLIFWIKKKGVPYEL